MAIIQAVLDCANAIFYITVSIVLLRYTPMLIDAIKAGRHGSRINAETDKPSFVYEKAVGPKQTKVEDLPPDTIAPNIGKPPRPPGGFGSAVGKTHGNS